MTGYDFVICVYLGMGRQNVTQMVTTHPIVKSLMKRAEGIGRFYKGSLLIPFLLFSHARFI
jgi:hypothetical protein